MNLKHYLEYKKLHTHILIPAVYDHISMKIKKKQQTIVMEVSIKIIAHK